MKISFLKTTQDKENYKIAQGFGMDIFEIDDPEIKIIITSSKTQQK